MFIRLLKISGLIILFGISLMAVILMYVHTNEGKQFLKRQVEHYLGDKLNTVFSIQSVDFHLPTDLELRTVYIEDQHGDTLLYGKKIDIQLSMFKLLFGETDITQISLDHVNLHLTRKETDSVFNYQFIIDAFSGKKGNVKVFNDTIEARFLLRSAKLNEVLLHFNDAYTGNFLFASIHQLQTGFTHFQTKHLRFGLSTLTADGILLNLLTIQGTQPSHTAEASEPQVQISADHALFKHVKTNIQHKVNGLIIQNDLSELRLEKADLQLKLSAIEADSAILEHSTISIHRAKIERAENYDIGNIPSDWKVNVRNLDLNDNSLAYHIDSIPVAKGFDVNHLNLRQISMQARNVSYSTDHFLSDILQCKAIDQSGLQIDTMHALIRSTKQALLLDELYLKTPYSLIRHTIRIEYGDTNEHRTDRSKIYANINESDIAFNDLYRLFPSLSNSLPEKEFRDQRMHIHTTLSGSFAHMKIPYLELSGLTGSSLKASAELWNLSDSHLFHADLNILKSRLNKQDIARFVRLSPDQYRQIPTEITLRGKAIGGMKDIMLQIKLSGAALKLDANARLQHLRQSHRFSYAVNIRHAEVHKGLLLAFLPASQQPLAIELPEQILLQGSVGGDINNIRSDLHIDGSFGKLYTKGYVRNFTGKEKLNYDLQINATAFDLGKFLKKDSLFSQISMRSHIKGNGYDPKTMKLDMHTSIDQFGMLNYNYQHIEINTRIKDGLADGESSIEDPNLRMHNNVVVNLRGEYPTGEMNLVLDTVRLKALHLISDTLNMSLSAKLMVNDITKEHLTASLSTDLVRMQLKQQHYTLDSTIIRATHEAHNQYVRMQSPLLDLEASGAYNYNELWPSIRQYISRYTLASNDTLSKIVPQSFAIRGVIKKHPVVLALIPGLHQYDSITFTGQYASTSRDSILSIKADMPSIAYKQYHLSRGTLELAGVNARLQLSAKADTLQIQESALYGLRVHAFSTSNSAGLSFAAKDIDQTERYAIGLAAAIHDRSYDIHLLPELMLNYRSWSVSPENMLYYSPAGFYARHIALNNKEEAILIESETQQINSPIFFKISNFDLRNITSILNKDSALATGYLNATLTASEFDKNLPAFTGELSLDHLAIRQHPVGNIHLQASKIDTNTIAAELRLSENGNDILANGHYYLNGKTKQFDATLNIARFNMASIEGITSSFSSEHKGSIHGNLALEGKFAEPHWQGTLYFDDPSFRATALGTTYSLRKQQVVLNYPDITFDQFTILDSANNPLKINGTIRSRSISNYDLDLDLHSTNFIVVNTAKNTNQPVYGFAAVNTDLSVQSNAFGKDIQGTIGLNDKSNATVILPKRNMNREASKAVIRFIDVDTFALPEKVLFVPESPATIAIPTTINYNVNVILSPKASLTVVVDQSTGDELKLSGDAKLSAGTDPGGNLLLSGVYYLEKGKYTLHYQFLKRDFTLLKGSTITFGGPAMDAVVNIQAEYIAYTAAIDLVGNELGDINGKSVNSFNQKIPFRVLLYLKGTLKKLEISFDIQLPQENQGINSLITNTVENKLRQLRQDPSAINKQVFSLLVMNRFVGEQSSDFFKGNESELNDMARESVSKFLSAALDQLAADLIKGVDIDLNLNSYRDFSTGDEQQRTDLNVAITKRFLDDRLSVSIGKNLGIEGQDKSAKAREQNTASYMPDATVNYKLSKDGKYMIRAYTKNKFEVIMDGYIVESGLSFLVTVDYETFKELWRKPSNN